ncbi:energy-coupling factor transport system permease protein [Clostridium collagenovorans DSM 3089]|uniref:Energy-coupling factor transport system permease protein n=1 Tax=Clostridium collagenovorans DSM 3089 TaxID=1121306 RepID=A0A1M5VEE8_9CLOT|nr:energy-coupling factor transporter transmembrane component T [Clostridium collagenovorans]SHH73629.1 energy-coupling factor transport system permease protein [Clostridium collagenovorans DSM 3089]
MELKSYNSFAEYHPVVNFLYFASVIVFNMIFMHPIFLIIGLSAFFIYSISLNGVKAIKFNLYFLLPMMIMIIVLNPLFSHQGMTILFYLNNKPMTLESFLYGIATAVMLINMVMVFSCYNKVITSEKFIYMFSKTVPAIALLISMTLSFVPKFKQQLKKIRTSQRNIGRDINNGTVIQRVKHGCTIISILITWALENGVQTADSMRGRGYGLSGRTSFSLYKLEKRDKVAIAILCFLISVCTLGYVYGINTMQFYPNIYMKKTNIITIFMYICYGILVFFPLAIEVEEAIRWNLLKSKI